MDPAPGMLHAWQRERFVIDERNSSFLSYKYVQSSWNKFELNSDWGFILNPSKSIWESETWSCWDSALALVSQRFTPSKRQDVKFVSAFMPWPKRNDVFPIHGPVPDKSNNSSFLRAGRFIVSCTLELEHKIVPRKETCSIWGTMSPESFDGSGENLQMIEAKLQEDLSSGFGACSIGRLSHSSTEKCFNCKN